MLILKSYWDSWRARKNDELFEERIWNEIFWKNKVLSRLVDWALSNGMLIHQLIYIKKVLKGFLMGKSHPLSSRIYLKKVLGFTGATCIIYGFLGIIYLIHASLSVTYDSSVIFNNGFACVTSLGVSHLLFLYWIWSNTC